MSDTNGGTAVEPGQAPQEPTPQAPDNAGTASQPDEVTTLRSRNAGLDAKVTDLSKQLKAAKEAADAAATKLSEYEAGKVSADEALRAQLEAKDAELATIKREALLAGIRSQYPETFGVFGDACATMSADQLAAAEARFAGVEETPRPQGANPQRAQAAAPKREEDMSAKELWEKVRSYPPEVLYAPRVSAWPGQQ